MMLLRRLAMLFALLLAAPALADDPPPSPLQGTWVGTIGTLPVRACLVQDGNGDVRGAYYYMSHLVPIGLSAKGASELDEQDLDKPTGPKWKISVSGDHLTGQWLGGTRQLPINITRAPLAPGDQADFPCGNRAFFAPVIAGLGWKDARASFAGLAYRKHTMVAPPALKDRVAFEVIQLDGSQQGDARINAALMKDAEPWGEDGWVACITNALVNNFSALGDNDASQAPVLLTRRYLSEKYSFSADCGGAHPDAGWYYTSYDRATGQRIDPARWFLPRAVPPPDKTDEPLTRSDTSTTLAPALNKIVLARYHPDDKECEISPDDSAVQFWWIGLSPRGFIFTPSLPHVIEACQDDIVVPLKAVSAMLTPAGRAAVGSFMR